VKRRRKMWKNEGDEIKKDTWGRNDDGTGNRNK
jgi:hypothetical protein